MSLYFCLNTLLKLNDDFVRVKTLARLSMMEIAVQVMLKNVHFLMSNATRDIVYRYIPKWSTKLQPSKPICQFESDLEIMICPRCQPVNVELLTFKVPFLVLDAAGRWKTDRTSQGLLSCTPWLNMSGGHPF